MSARKPAERWGNLCASQSSNEFRASRSHILMRFITVKTLDWQGILHAEEAEGQCAKPARDSRGSGSQAISRGAPGCARHELAQAIARAKEPNRHLRQSGHERGPAHQRTDPQTRVESFFVGYSILCAQFIEFTTVADRVQMISDDLRDQLAALQRHQHPAAG